MTAPALQPHPQDKYCTEKCDECCEFSLINGNEIFVCMKGGYEVIPVEIDLTPGVGQSSPFENTTCEFQATTHTSPPAQFKCPDCERLFDSDIHLGIHHYTDHAIKHDAQVAKAAREDALNEFMMAIEYRFEDTNNGRGVVGTIRGLKESLRAQQGGVSE